MRKTLQRLATRRHVGLAILSGRAVPDLKARARLSRVVYGGCHGLEIEGPGFRFRHPLDPSIRNRLRIAAVALEEIISRFPGADLEWKGFAVAVHCRKVASSRLGPLFKLTKEVSARADLGILLGEKVWDLVPPGHPGKSKAVSLIRDHLKARLDGRPPLTVYAGDDAVETRAFASLQARDITVQVGGKRRTADYHLRGVPEVHALLRWIDRVTARVHRSPYDVR